MTLYRQYRPTRFSELISQDRVRTLLTNALTRNQIAHAYLFAGSRGTGKTSTARIFATSLCCTNRGDSAEACGTCTACVLIQKNQATDVIEIDAASNRSIEDIRSLRDTVAFPPMQLLRKIYIIDECHMLTGDAFNALLKTLEEPPAHALFILATTELHRVPATVRSRCQLLTFNRPNPSAIVEKLTQVVTAENWDYEPAALTYIAEAADGAFRDAEGLLEQLHNELGSLKTAAVAEALGRTDSILVTGLLDLALAGPSELFEKTLTETLRNQIVSSEPLTMQLIDSLLAQPLNAHTTYGLQQLMESIILSKSSPLPYLALEIALRNISLWKPLSNTSTHHSNRVIPSESPAPVVVKTVPPDRPAPITVPVVDLHVEKALPVATQQSQKTDGRPATASDANTYSADIRKAWKEIVHDIGADNPSLAGALKQTTIHTAQDGILTMHVRYVFHRDKLTEKKHKQVVEKLLRQKTEETWQVVYEVNTELPKQQVRARIQAPDAISSDIDPNDVAAIFTSESK
jgi:DNA polymerase III subunit gamma/tau